MASGKREPSRVLMDVHSAQRRSVFSSAFARQTRQTCLLTVLLRKLRLTVGTVVLPENCWRKCRKRPTPGRTYFNPDAVSECLRNQPVMAPRPAPEDTLAN